MYIFAKIWGVSLNKIRWLWFVEKWYLGYSYTDDKVARQYFML